MDSRLHAICKQRHQIPTADGGVTKVVCFCLVIFVSLVIFLTFCLCVFVSVFTYFFQASMVRSEVYFFLVMFVS